MKRASHFEQRRDAGAVVERAIVDAISGPRTAFDADVIGVAHQRDVFVLQAGVGAFDDADDLGTREPAHFGGSA